MAAIMCELCGSNDVVKQGEYFVCQHCGTKYTVEDAKKLIGTVKIDKTDEVQKYLQIARNAKQKEDRLHGGPLLRSDEKTSVPAREHLSRIAVSLEWLYNTYSRSMSRLHFIEQI